MADRTVSVKLVADVGGFQSGMTKASAATRGLGGDFDKTQQQADRGFRSISQGAGALTGSLKTAGAALGGLAVVDFFRDSINAASDLNETLNKSNVIFGDNAAKIEKWSQGAAKNFGLSQQAALDAASGFGNMLTQLGYTGDAATTASTDVVGLAADLGSFNNLETGDVLERISAAMRGEYDSLQLLIPNINAARVEQEAMAETGKKNKDELTAQEKAAAVLAIVHKDGAAAANDFAETQDGLANKTKIAAAQFEDLKSKIGQAFLPIAQDAMGFLSSTAIPALEGVFDTVMDLVGVFGDLPGSLQLAIGAFGLWMVAGDQIKGALSGISGAMTPVKDTARAFGDAMDYARANGDGFGTVLRSVGDYAGGQALTAFKNLARAIGPELGIAAGVFAVSQIIDGFQLLTGASDDAKAAAEGLADALTLTNEVADRQAIRQAIENTEGLAEALEQAGISSTVAIDGLLGQEDATKRVTTALQDYISLRPGGAHNDEATGALMAKHAYEELATGYGTAASNARYFADEGSDAAASTASAEDAATTAAPVVDDLATQFEGLAEAADAAKKRADDFKLSLDILTGAHVSMIQLESAFQASLAEAAGAMEDLDGKAVDASGNLDLQSEAGRKASDVLLGVRDSGNELIAQMIAQGGTTDEVKAKDAELRDSFIHTAQQMGISKDAANLLADQILGIPAERQTTITADTDPAAAKIAALQTQIDQIAKDRVASINFRATLPDLNGSVSGSGRPGMADGGYTGPGAKYDPAPYQVHRGEIVWSQSDIAAHGGVSQVESMRRSRPMGYANGGVVGLTAYADTSNVSSGLSTFADLLGTAVSKAATSMAVGPSAAAGVQQWLPVVLQALGMVGQPASLAQTVLRRMNQESGGNARAINNWDINAKNGVPSKGLMQVIDPTFRANAYPGYSSNIYDPLSNILASMQYAIRRYGSLSAAYNKAGGYANGGTTPAGEPFWVGERGPELMWSSREQYVTTAAQSREFSGATAGRFGGSAVTVSIEGATITGTFEIGGDGLGRIVDGRVVSAVTTIINRGAYNG